MFRSLSVTAFAVLALVAVVSLTRCGGSSAGDATATLQFNKLNRAFLRGDLFAPRFRADATPDVFRMKLIAAYLAEDIAPGTGENVGQTTMFWLNPECNEDIGHCDIEPGNTGVNGEAITEIVNDFFDFSDVTATNTALNAQSRSIQSGSYKYVRIEFCKGASGGTPNVEFDVTARSDGPGSYQVAQCTVNSVEIDPPLTIATGGSATVTLAYDLTDAAKEFGTSQGVHCISADAATVHLCLELPAFTPSASRR